MSRVGKKPVLIPEKTKVSYENRVISPAIQESVKAATAKYTAEELITKRSVDKEDTRAAIAERLLNYHIIIDDFSIVDFSFSPEFDLAIEAIEVAHAYEAHQLVAPLHLFHGPA